MTFDADYSQELCRTLQEPELDDLVGKLLCSSMESMLFEKNDDLFVARTSSLMSVSSANTPRNHSSCGESTDMSSDEEMLHDSACSSPRKAASTIASLGFAGDSSEFGPWEGPLRPNTQF